jgi:cell volume regulation protein A
MERQTLLRRTESSLCFFMGYWLGNSDFVGKTRRKQFFGGDCDFRDYGPVFDARITGRPESLCTDLERRPSDCGADGFYLQDPLPYDFNFSVPLFIQGSWIPYVGRDYGGRTHCARNLPPPLMLDSNGNVFNIIFFAVIFSCLVQGSTLGRLAKFLKLTGGAKQQVSPFFCRMHSVKKSDLDCLNFIIRK